MSTHPQRTIGNFTYIIRICHYPTPKFEEKPNFEEKCKLRDINLDIQQQLLSITTHCGIVEFIKKQFEVVEVLNKTYNKRMFILLCWYISTSLIGSLSEYKYRHYLRVLKEPNGTIKVIEPQLLRLKQEEPKQEEPKQEKLPTEEPKQEEPKYDITDNIFIIIAILIALGALFLVSFLI